VESQIGEFRDQRTLVKRAKGYSEEIAEINEKLKQLNKDMEHIHA